MRGQKPMNNANKLSRVFYTLKSSGAAAAV